MPNAQMVQKFAMDLNGTGTLVEVTQYVRGADGVQKTGTKQDQFRDSVAATYTFVLENYDGRFTPGNPNSPYPATPTERMTVNWSSGGRLFQGSILTLTPGDDNWTLLTITCDDMLGAASRNSLANLGYSQVMGSSPYLFWPLNDPAGSGQAAEATGNGTPLVLNGGSSYQIIFGTAGTPSLVDTQLQIGSSSGITNLSSGTGFFTTAAGSTFVLPAGSLGFMGITETPIAPNGDTVVISTSGTSAFQIRLTFTSAGVSANVIAGTASATTAVVAYTGSPQIAVGVAYSGTAPTVTYTVTLYLNGTATATATAVSVTAAATTATNTVGGMSVAGSEIFSHFWYGPTLIHEEWAGITTEANRLMAIDQTTSQVTLATLPADLSTAPIGYAATSGQSALDAFNGLNKTEQGYVDCVTAGTFTAPTQTVRFRARQRPVAVSYSFDAQLELVDASGSPEVIPFTRDSTNLIWSDQITGANSTSQTVSQVALQQRAGSNNSSDTVSTFQPSDLYEWGSDRLWRGANVALRPVSITIDNLTCPTDRSADFNAMVPGDRIHVTNIPNTVLGFTTWDGWLLDKDENHRSGMAATDRFTLYLQPCQPNTMIWDTDLWANGGNNTISTALTSGATSMLCTSADVVTLFETSAMNYYLQVDSEVVKVTACSAPVAGVQTLTITRAQFSTAAAAHAVGAVPEVYADSTGRLNNAIWAF